MNSEAISAGMKKFRTTRSSTLKVCTSGLGDFHVLEDINLDGFQGERIVICGPSGSGKSTLIRCINRPRGTPEREDRVDGPSSPATFKNIEKNP